MIRFVEVVCSSGPILLNVGGGHVLYLRDATPPEWTGTPETRIVFAFNGSYELIPPESPDELIGIFGERDSIIVRGSIQEIAAKLERVVH